MDKSSQYSPTSADINECNTCNWYESFKAITVESILIPLPLDFLSYLEEDGLILPSSHETKDYLSDDDDTTTIDANQPAQSRNFPELEQLITDAIKQLGGEVFVKLNWGAATDAAWINGHSTKCQRYADVILLLKSSDRIMFDINNMYDTCSCEDEALVSRLQGRTLVLKKWIHIEPSMEFRLFIQDNKLRGICQRNTSTFFPFLKTEVDRLKPILQRFYTSKIQGKFSLSSYTVDILISKNSVKLLDFNVFGPPTISLLFDWDEDFIDNHVIADGYYDFRVVESNADVQPDEAGRYRGPIDVSLAPDFAKFMDICKQQQQQDDVDEDELN